MSMAHDSQPSLQFSNNQLDLLICFNNFFENTVVSVTLFFNSARIEKWFADKDIHPYI